MRGYWREFSGLPQTKIHRDVEEPEGENEPDVRRCESSCDPDSSAEMVCDYRGDEHFDRFHIVEPSCAFAGLSLVTRAAVSSLSSPDFGKWALSCLLSLFGGVYFFGR